MATKVEQSSLETQRVQAEGSMSASSAVAAGSPKISMFGKKKGFVIPKNKLSGSLVPMIRSGSRSEVTDGSKDESAKQVQRKTKWGVDLLQEAAVRRGRALAYQTRIEQITKQLDSGVLEYEDDQDLLSASTTASGNSTDQVDKEKMLKFLELERQEAIGECIRLNPNYKAPPGYKPVLREAKVPVPLKAYPSINFVALILGPGSSTKKRLEEETGAKIRIHGRKAESGEKVEVSQLDNNEAQGGYEELYVHISAETYEKVDAAVALVGLLVTPISGENASSTDTPPVSGDVTASDQNPVVAQGYMMPMALGNLGIQPGPPQGPYQLYSAPWQPPNFLMRPSYAFPLNSIPLAHAPLTFPPSSITPFNMPQLLTGPPAIGVLAQAQVSIRSQPPIQVQPLGRPIPGQPLQPFPSASCQQVTFSAGQSPSAASVRMLVTTMQPSAHRVMMPPNAGVTNAPLPNQPILGAPQGWSPSPATLPPVRLTNMITMPPRGIPVSPGPASSVTQPLLPSINRVSMAPTQPPSGIQTFSSQVSVPSSVYPIPPSSMLAQPLVPPAIRLTQSSLAGPPSAPTAVPMPLIAAIGPLPAQAPGPTQVSAPPSAAQAVLRPIFAPNVMSSTAQAPPTSGQQPARMLSSSAAASVQPTIAQAISPTPGSAQLVPTGQRLPQGPVISLQPAFPLPVTGSGAFSNLPSSNAFPAVLKPLCPSSSDFTFQPQKPLSSASQSETKPSIQSALHITPPVPALPLIPQQPPPQVPSFRPAVPNLPQSVIPGVLRPQIPVSNRAILHSPTDPGFGSSPSIAQPPLKFHSVGPPRLLNPVLQTAPSNSAGRPSSDTPVPFHGSAPFQPGNMLQVRNSSQMPMAQPAGLMVPNEQTSQSPGCRPMGIQAPIPSNTNQVYDPFSPTSVSSIQSQQSGGGGKAGTQSRKSETDAEYEDLMASVGVK